MRVVCSSPPQLSSKSAQCYRADSVISGRAHALAPSIFSMPSIWANWIVQPIERLESGSFQQLLNLRGRKSAAGSFFRIGERIRHNRQNSCVDAEHARINLLESVHNRVMPDVIISTLHFQGGRRHAIDKK